ncbi:MAG: family 78 glycoside hydrolase catalytic domain [Clostridia bacterium]|nr:family 78 glycoside hydrolase catalytic domain [Clostridia bacterium]
MVTVFENAEWIWNDKAFTENEYAEFLTPFIWTGKNTSINISVCGDYTLFVNGRYVASNQYADFEHYKVYDTIEITEYLQDGSNTVAILVWYFGKSGMRYLTPNAGVIFEIFDGDGVLCQSNTETLSRKSKAYMSGEVKKITPQLGFSYTYDATKEDSWLCGSTDGFSASVIIQDKQEFYGRPIIKHKFCDLKKGEIISREKNRYLIDLSEETVGAFSFSFMSDSRQKINISYGECLKDGHIKRIIGNRDFSFDYIAQKGQNTYTNYMLRIAGRYIEIEYEEDIQLEYAGILPQVYPIKEIKPCLENPLDMRIYEICINTLKLCMMEHYVDCPWREQGLYAYDSRNQILSGYYAFEGGNADYAKANLYLMSKDRRDDKLLSICFPSGEDLTIPAFSMYYILAVQEYLEYSGDLAFAETVFDKLTSLIEAICANMSDGLVCGFSGENHWNFYDWSPYAEGNLMCDDGKKPDFMINCVFLLGLKAYDEICKKLSKVNGYSGLFGSITEKLREHYQNKETGMFFTSDITEEATELANSFAVILDIADKKQAEIICEKLAHGELAECSLSMKPFKYDAMIKVNKEKYKPFILQEIRETYKKMLDFGSTTVWETIEGESAFDDAGSLCHGWSAIPIYYYNIL